MFRMVILGAPGSGKGTISNRIIRDFALKHLSIGDVLRAHVNNRTFTGLEAETYMKVGQLVPNVVMLKLIASELARLEATPWLLDGFPRTLLQAQDLLELTKMQKIKNKEFANGPPDGKLDLVLGLEVPSQVIIDRIKDRWIHQASGRIYNTSFNPPKTPGKDDLTGENLTQRPDDAAEAVLRRLQLYEKNTKPIKDFYASVGILKEFAGTESNEIYPRVKHFLEEIIPRQHHIKERSN